MSIGSNIKRLRTDAQLSQAELGKIAGVTDKAVSTWEAGIKTPRMGAVEKMAAYFGVPKSAILDDVYKSPAPVPPGFEPLPEMESVPLVGRIACGQPITAEENLEGYVSIPAAWHATFTLQCRGDSMEPRIKDGDLVAIRKDVQVENGQIAAVRIGDEATLKHLYLHEDYIELRPENPTYSSIIRRKEEMNDVTIEGKAVGLCRGL